MNIISHGNQANNNGNQANHGVHEWYHNVPMLGTDVCDHLSAIGGGFSSHHPLQWLHLQASNFDELMVGEPVASLHNTSVIGLVFTAYLSS